MDAEPTSARPACLCLLLVLGTFSSCGYLLVQHGSVKLPEAAVDPSVAPNVSTPQIPTAPPLLATTPGPRTTGSSDGALGYRGSECFTKFALDGASSLHAFCRKQGGRTGAVYARPQGAMSDGAIINATNFKSDLDHCVLLESEHSRLNATHRCVAWRTGTWATELVAAEVDAAYPGDLPVCDIDALVRPASDGGPRMQEKADGTVFLNVSGCGGVLTYLTPLQLLAVLRRATDNGTRPMVISGDSMMRQVQMRLLFAMRGAPIFIEPTGWLDSTYVIRAKSDELQYRVSDQDRTGRYAHLMKPEPRPKCVIDDPDDPCLLHVQFLWEPYENPLNPFMLWRNEPPRYAGSEPKLPPSASPVACRWDGDLGVTLAPGKTFPVPVKFLPAVHLHATMYWFNTGKRKRGSKSTRKPPPRTLPVHTKQVFAYYGKIVETVAANGSQAALASCTGDSTAAAKQLPYRFLDIGTPHIRIRPGHPDDLDLYERNEMIQAREFLIRDLTGNTTAQLRAIQAKTSSAANAVTETSPRRRERVAFRHVDFNGAVHAALSPRAIDVRSKDNRHFMCGFIPQFPLQPLALKSDQSGCRDEVNMALVQWIARLLVEQMRP